MFAASLEPPASSAPLLTLGVLGRLVGIPSVLIHGRLAIGSPPVIVLRLSPAWPVLLDAGHLNTGPGTTAAVVVAIDRFVAMGRFDGSRLRPRRP